MLFLRGKGNEMADSLLDGLRGFWNYENKERLNMTIVIRGEYYIMTMAKKDVDELRYALPSKISELITQAENDVDKFATNDMVVKTTGS
jgi:hypothetical protein